MRFVSGILAAALAIALPHQASRTAVRFAHLWDGERLVDDATVVIEDGRVASVLVGSGQG